MFFAPLRARRHTGETAAGAPGFDDVYQTHAQTVVGYDSFDQNLLYSRTAATPSWLSPRSTAAKVSKVSPVGERGVGLRCARDM